MAVLYRTTIVFPHLLINHENVLNKYPQKAIKATKIKKNQ